MSLGMANEDESIQDVVQEDKVDADKDNNENKQDIESYKTTESVVSKVERIVFGALAKVELDEKDNPLLSSFKKNKDDNFIPRHIIDDLLTEIYALLGSDHRTINYTNNRNAKACTIINVPKHDNGATFLHLSRRKNNCWLLSMLAALASNTCEMKDAAAWMSTYLGHFHNEEASKVASKMNLGGSNKKMDAVSFHAMGNAVNAILPSNEASNATSLHSLVGQCLRQTKV
jgi:hypothetical protein